MRSKMRSILTSIHQIWNSANKPKASEIIVNILGKAIHRTVATRWNSVFDCIVKILKFDQVKLADLMLKLGIPEFSVNDVAFLHEYIKVLTPIAKALDCLQADCYFAILLPILHNTKQDFLQMKHENLKYAEPLIDAVVDGLNERFGYLFDFDDERCKPALVATCSHPYFKTRWLIGEMNSSENLQKIRTIMISAANSMNLKQINKENITEFCRGEPFSTFFYMDFIRIFFHNFSIKIAFPIKSSSYQFRFNETEVHITDRIDSELDIGTFLRKPCSTSETDLASLRQHQFVERLFRKFNATCTSSAPAERLFSYAGNTC